jgi:putative acetyltransferase
VPIELASISVDSSNDRSAGVVIRAQRPGERAAVRDVLVRSFGRPEVGDLAEALQDGRPPRRSLSFVAEDQGEVVGHVLLSTSWLDAPQRVVDVLVLSPLGVAPEQQRRGIGDRLVRHALREAENQEWPLVFLEGSPHYYQRFGFQAAGGLGFTAPSVRIPPPGFQVVTLPSWQPWMIGALAYADPFWCFDCVGLR